jgi:hypothetical protein
MSGGRAWLVHVPLRGDSKVAATALVALSPPNREEAFKSALFGPMLLMSDLIAHKGYSLMRDYRGELQQSYKNKLKDFWEVSAELLDDLEGQMQRSGKLDEVARWYSTLASVVSKFHRMSISMAQQLHNYDRWLVQEEDNAIVEYHYRHLETANRELLVAQGRDALEVADKALSMARVEVDKAQQSNQRLISLLLAVVSAGLAAPNLAQHFWGDNALAKVTAIVIVAALILALVGLVGRWHGSHLLARGLETLRTRVGTVLQRRRGSSH